ncbi:hypothetical protein V6C03_08975 [Methyloligella sp. 2.7D]|uniref:hypothetical protein n=1 Tax=unclassified Methyloligella TaxID=2625955 RepID=UPI00157BD8C2|nr:hypothetical protein [Methyloligella sp. GL2]QKP78006.1 hypothetical protein HT051_11475 [Methyloligella sp. GL2]
MTLIPGRILTIALFAAAILALALPGGANAQTALPGVSSGIGPGPRLVKPAFGVAGECQPIDFDNVEIQYYRGRGIYQLKVSGFKKFSNMEVSLSHQSYSRRPAYWTTVVVGCWKNFLVLPVPTPYYVTMPLTDFVGTRGVEIVGATRTVRRNVPQS